MDILLVHNDYSKFGGEERAIQRIATVLQSRGHSVAWYRKSSEDIGNSALGRARAFFSGIYSLDSKVALAELLERRRFDVVQFQNLYPLISSSVLPVCKGKGIPVVMRCPNYRLFCPIGLHLRDGKVCERCLGAGREWHCIVGNCNGDLAKSIGYAARNAFARISRMIVDNVTVFVVLSEFQKARFVRNGIPPEKIEILPNTAPHLDVQESSEVGEHIAFVGRVSEEKGIREFLEAARALPALPFALAGEIDGMADVVAQAPKNVNIRGMLNGPALAEFYSRSMMVVVPSKWFEGFPNVIAEAMAYGKPVVAARIGAIPEIVDEGVTGLLFEPGNEKDLSEKIQFLSDRPQKCKEMGQAAVWKARTDYGEERFYDLLTSIYKKATQIGSREYPAPFTG